MSGKYLITGAAGFIGSSLAQRLLAEGKTVIGVDNFNDYYSPIFKQENVQPFAKNKKFKLYKIDITDVTKLNQVFGKEKPKKVIHLAARAGVRPSLEDPGLYQQVNIEGTLNILEACRRYKVKQLVFASSSSVYGGSTQVPFTETETADRPISPYAATKRAGEMLCFNYHHLYGLPVTCLRFFTVYGPKGRPDMAPYMFTELVYQGKGLKMFGDGSSRRDYTYIDDIIDGISKSLDKELGFEIINLGNSQTVPLKYFINLVGKILKKPVKVTQVPEQPGDVPITYANIAKAKKLLGYSPKTSFDQGMKKLVSWYLDNRI